MSIADMKMQQKYPATMFLPQLSLPSLSSRVKSKPSDQPVHVRSKPQTIDRNNKDESSTSNGNRFLSQLSLTSVPQQLQTRRILGFDVAELFSQEKSCSHSSSSSSTSLDVSRQTKFDSTTWNGDVDKPFFRSTVGLPTTLRPGLSAINAVALAAGATTDVQGLPLWFPWIPSKSQIESLKLTELKEACAQRRLVKTGNKAELQERLWNWTVKQQQEHQARLTEDYQRWVSTIDFERSTPTIPRRPTDKSSSAPASSPSPSPSSDWSSKTIGKSSPNSLAEWTRTVDLKPLLDRREKIHRDKRQGRQSTNRRRPKESVKQERQQNKKEYLSSLAKAVKAPSSPFSSNVEVKELYLASKEADLLGERKIAKTFLNTLLQLTPNDARVYRRLARMATEEGDIGAARAVLQDGCRRLPKNGYLWHGLGKLELKQGAVQHAREHFRKAISVDPSLPHPYHALGTLEHTEGRISRAMRILKDGIQFCPANHRLHHALGDLYRDAKLLDDAERSYRKALEFGPPVSKCFAYSALASVAYDKQNVEECRYWLRKSLAVNNGRHSQGWVALAQMEEAEGNVNRARSVCVAAITQYERVLLAKKQEYKTRFDNRRKRLRNISGQEQDDSMQSFENDNFSLSSLNDDLNDDPIELKNRLLKSVPRYRSGDRFLKMYRNWARLEEHYGTFETVDEVYSRASAAFPFDYKLTLDWAQYHAILKNSDRARSLLMDACAKSSNRHADPFRIHAEYEMYLGRFREARSILYRGALAVSKSSDGGLGNKRGLAELFHTWAVCEWHLDNIPRADVLFDHALRLTDAGEEGSKLRSSILYSIANLEYYRGELHLAQHCLCLCLKENLLPGGNSKIWNLWAMVAAEMGNDVLKIECEKQSQLAKRHEEDNGVAGMSRLLKSTTPGVSSSGLSRMKGPEMQQWMRRDPWHQKLFGNISERDSAKSFFGLQYPRAEWEESHKSFRVTRN